VVPASWLVADHVHEGREHLDFSNWGSLPPDEQAHLADEMIEEIDEADMPLPSYLWTHGDAELSAEDRQVLQHWASALIKNAAIGR
jgi:hypothetical protein